MKPLDLYFFYKKREKIRGSFFLNLLVDRVRKTILKVYKPYNYKFIDRVISFAKFLIVSLFYFICYMTTSMNSEFYQLIPYALYMGIGFFSVLSILVLTGRDNLNLHKDHYFRMLSEKRNTLVKEALNKRINYIFFNWIVPFTFFPFLYISLIDESYHVFYWINYTILLYFSTKLLSFLTQRIFFEYLKGAFILKEFLQILLTVIVLLTALVINISFLAIVDLLHINLDIRLLSIFWIVSILPFSLLQKNVYGKTINYSLTNRLISVKKKQSKHNRIRKPSRFAKILFGKNNFRNQLLNKDLIRFYRKEKPYFFSIVVHTIIAILYSLFLITSLRENGSITTVIVVDNIFFGIIISFIISYMYKFKDETWYSSEKQNIKLFHKIGYDKHEIYKVKLKLNYIVFSPIILGSVVVPVFFAFNVNIQSLLYILIRIPIQILYISLIIRYLILEDTKHPRIKAGDHLTSMGAVTMIALVIIVQIMGFTYGFISMDNYNHILSSIKNLEWHALVGILVLMIIIRVKYHFHEKKFFGNTEEKDD